MNYRKALISSTIAISALCAAAYADAAKADENPYHPAPIASSETFDHGAGTYCTKPILGTCSLGDVRNGGTGTGTPDPTSAEKQAFGAANQPKSDPCGPKS